MIKNELSAILLLRPYKYATAQVQRRTHSITCTAAQVQRRTHSITCGKITS